MALVLEKKTISWGGINLEVAERRKETGAERSARNKREAAANDNFRRNAEAIRANKRWMAEHPDVYARIHAEDFDVWFESVTGKKWSKSWEGNFYKIQEELDRADALINEHKAIREYAKLSLREFNKLSHAERRGIRIVLATPEWCDRDAIRNIYMDCKIKTLITGIPHHVDHIIPIAGELVCGFHVHTNLRIITAKENLTKNNKFNP